MRNEVEKIEDKAKLDAIKSYIASFKQQIEDSGGEIEITVEELIISINFFINSI